MSLRAVPPCWQALDRLVGLIRRGAVNHFYVNDQFKARGAMDELLALYCATGGKHRSVARAVEFPAICVSLRTQAQTCWAVINGSCMPVSTRSPILGLAVHPLPQSLARTSLPTFLLQGLRQDCTVQHLRNELAVAVYEAHARAELEYGDLAEFNQCVFMCVCV
jgi:hypothetical protein